MVPPLGPPIHRVPHSTLKHNMRARTLVSITKRAECRTPISRAGDCDTFTPGAFNPTASLPIDYEIVGYLIDDIEVGKAVRMLRLARNGEMVPGYYQSTTVVELQGDGYVTKNSVYSVKIVDANA